MFSLRYLSSFANLPITFTVGANAASRKAFAGSECRINLRADLNTSRLFRLAREQAGATHSD